MECEFVERGNMENGWEYETYKIDGCQYAFSKVDECKFPTMKDVVEVFVGFENGDCIYWDVVRGKTINEGLTAWIKKLGEDN